MKVFVLLLGSALISSLAIAVPFPQAQQWVDNPKADDLSFYLDQSQQLQGPIFIWNDARHELVSSGSYEHQQFLPEPIINIYNPDSREKRSINILKDFPNASEVTVDAVAVGSSGSLLVGCGLDISVPGQHAYVEERILLYDEHSALKKNFSAMPDDVGAVAMDGQGDMFILGTHDDEKSDDETYSLIVKYDASGHIVQKMLPRSLFAESDDPVGDGGEFPHRGGTRMWITENAVKVYLAPVDELITLNQTGEIQKRIRVSDRLSEYARGKGYKTIFVDDDKFSPSGDLWLTGHFEESLDNQPTTHTLRNFVVRLAPDGQLVPYQHVDEEPPGHFLPELVGFTQSDEPVGVSIGLSSRVLLRKNPF